jgi:hypothetical protein
MRYVQLMSTTTGRVVRAIAGLALIVFGVWTGGAAGWALAVVGVEPLSAGLLNFSLVAPLFHERMRGSMPHHA